MAGNKKSRSKKVTKKKATRTSKINRDIVKDMTTPRKKSSKLRRYVRSDKVDVMKAKGWKEVKEPKDDHGRKLGVITNMSDLILMEK